MATIRVRRWLLDDLDACLDIVRALPEYFTGDVPDAIRRDLARHEGWIAEDGVPDWDTPMFHDTPFDEGSAMEAHTDLERALRRLPEEFRTVLLLAEVEGMPLEEVARVMACPVGTVKSRIFRAKERLRGMLKDYDSK